jgi:hypothetical protein
VPAKLLLHAQLLTRASPPSPAGAKKAWVVPAATMTIAAGVFGTEAVVPAAAQAGHEQSCSRTWDAASHLLSQTVSVPGGRTPVQPVDTRRGMWLAAGPDAAQQRRRQVLRSVGDLGGLADVMGIYVMVRTASWIRGLAFDGRLETLRGRDCIDR